MFSRGSRSSISLATVTPSLVIMGAPNFFSITALRPLGPRVIFTASARAFTPRRIAWRDASPVTICFAISWFLLNSDTGCLELCLFLENPQALRPELQIHRLKPVLLTSWLLWRRRRVSREFLLRGGSAILRRRF